jgi:LysM repeat protein
MKILKILGIVLGVHLTGFLLLFAIPGCHATSRKSQARQNGRTADPSVSGANNSGTSSNGSGQPSPSINNSDLNPGAPLPNEPISFGAEASSGGNRYNPTRPGTPVASALQAPAPSDVTPAKRYVVVKGDNLGSIAHKNGISKKELALANNMAVSDPIKVGQALLIPAKAPTPPPGPAQGAAADTLTYKVKKGETLESIAKRSGTTVAAIKSLNKLTTNSVKAGQDLILPATPNSTAALAATPDVEPVAKAPAGSIVKYTVKPNETLGAIATKFHVKMGDIAAANHIANPKSLRAGQELTIPTAGNQPPANAAPEKTPASAQPEPVSPISPASDASPVSAPSDPAPPVNRVDDGSPVSSGR